MNNIREEFEAWYEDMYCVEVTSDWSEERNCYNHHSNHMSFVAYRAASERNMEREAKDKELAELKDRMLAAEAYIAEFPCDPDIYESQYKAYAKWQELKNER